MVKSCLTIACKGISKVVLPNESKARPEQHRELVGAIGMWIEYQAFAQARPRQVIYQRWMLYATL